MKSHSGVAPAQYSPWTVKPVTTPRFHLYPKTSDNWPISVRRWAIYEDEKETTSAGGISWDQAAISAEYHFVGTRTFLFVASCSETCSIDRSAVPASCSRNLIKLES
ncbi:hypothetical protein H0G86_011453 [Trichoderma simmonsii]|uniref:Uncharacterized protein n=1 Tax=Trichoderma simmonsii TaxID=1491479 RepID=A0A8G0PJA2_9HYPO|nr:hypothetical protein H0G86_011453 [Trichoderma simmonsii]